MTRNNERYRWEKNGILRGEHARTRVSRRNHACGSSVVRSLLQRFLKDFVPRGPGVHRLRRENLLVVFGASLPSSSSSSSLPPPSPSPPPPPSLPRRCYGVCLLAFVCLRAQSLDRRPPGVTASVAGLGRVSDPAQSNLNRRVRPTSRARRSFSPPPQSAGAHG